MSERTKGRLIPAPEGAGVTTRDVRLTPWELRCVAAIESIGGDPAKVAALVRGCQAALAYLTDPPSEHASNRAEAKRIIRAALARVWK
jgi:hypothetical protein